ncbi:MAG: hypothetical protein EXR48_05320 [Dehalococcoidia bacterium]|nr:hypothetical protein [Dehalococcoidia bacterium]
MSLTRDEALQAAEKGWREFRHQLRDLDYSLDWKRNPNDDAEWSVRDILTHVLGTAEQFTLPTMRRMLAEETPTVEHGPGSPYRAHETRAMSLTQLRDRLDAFYQEVVSLLRSSTSEQLQRKVRITWLDGRPQTERNVLEMANRGLGVHWPEHALQLYALREELGVAEL